MEDSQIKPLKRHVHLISRMGSTLLRMIVGTPVMKFFFNKSGGETKHIFLASTMRHVGWSQTFEKRNSAKLIDLRHCKAVLFGTRSPNLRRVQLNVTQPAWRFFSIVTDERTYDFLTANDQEALSWVHGLRYLLSYMHGDVEYGQRPIIPPLFQGGVQSQSLMISPAKVLWQRARMRLGVP